MKIFFQSFILLMGLSLLACNSTNDAATNEVAATDSVALAEATVEEEPEKPTSMRAQNIAFEETLKDGGVSFTVSSPNVPEVNTMVIFSEGLEVRNDTFQIEVNGLVSNAEMADINKDGYPEVYVFTQQKENEEQGEVYVFTSYRNRTYGQAFLRKWDKANSLNTEVVTTDKFYLKDGQLIREIGTTSAGNQANSSQTETTVYELKAGEASYQLQPKQ